MDLMLSSVESPVRMQRFPKRAVRKQASTSVKLRSSKKVKKQRLLQKVHGGAPVKKRGQ